jgi:hypothetical protein
MATTASGLTFYEDQFETGFWEGITQYIELFNANSGGAIRLEEGSRKGRKPVRTFMSTPAGVIQRRDPSGTGTLTPVNFSNSEHRAVKIFRSAPVIWRRQDWVDQGMSDDAGQMLYGEMFGRLQAQDLVNTAIAALVGAINAIGATALLDITGESTKTPTFGAYSRLMNKLGDQRQAVRTLISHSTPLGTFIVNSINTQATAFQLGATTIYSGMIPAMGLKTLSTDAPGLLIEATSASGSVDTFNSLALVEGAVRIKTGSMGVGFTLIPGTTSAVPENLTWLLQTEYEFELEVRGVSYKAASADNPTAATLAASGNWSLVAADRKLGPGALLLSNGT